MGAVYGNFAVFREISRSEFTHRKVKICYNMSNSAARPVEGTA